MVVRVIQKNHRVAIPPEMWEGLGLREGDEVEIIREGGRIVILPIPEIKNPTEMLWSLPKPGVAVDQPDVVIEAAMGEMVEKEVRGGAREIRRFKRVHLRDR
jgi:AbrB family looped-hinge helix DNA binding protein